ncbi:DUF4430 domain-containing protein [Sporosarcina obsidiansis]|uniref:DUF4430 domain-containing protein n=1 Tax=Sporosarcina obsidiansis TaxID=2660748 RepID=UPI00129B7873|nr:DUF4430 domain-containing protein [Sporosarcina obsidiansis]
MGKYSESRKWFSILLSFLLVLSFFTPTVSADTLPDEFDHGELKSQKETPVPDNTSSIQVKNFEYGENVFQSDVALEIEALDKDGQPLVPKVERDNIQIEPNEDGFYETKLQEGLNRFRLTTVDSTGALIEEVFFLSYSKVKAIEFVPAPGQYTNGNYTKDAVKKIRSKNGGLLSLGGFGGYLIVEFEEPVKNNPLNPYGIDFTIFGNPFELNGNPGVYNQEPGAVEVAVHKDGPWYHLAGSEYKNKDTYIDYQVTYWNPNGSTENAGKWLDNKGNEGLLHHRNYPSSELFPFVNLESYTLSGVSILNDVSPSDIGTSKKQVRYGYADSVPVLNNEYEKPNNPYTSSIEGSGGDAMDISWAVDENGNSIHLDEIKYVKVYSATNKFSGLLGEVSTEVSGMGASEPVNQIPATIEIKSNRKVTDLPLGSTVQLTANAFDAQKKSVIIPEVTWTSMDQNIVTVDPITGGIKTVSEGEVTVTAKLKADETVRDEILITVGEKQIPTSMVVSSSSSQVVNVGGSSILTATIFDQHGNEIKDLENGFQWSLVEEEKGQLNTFGKTDNKKMVKGLMTGIVNVVVEYENLRGRAILKVLDPDISLDVSGIGFVNSNNLAKRIDKAKTKDSTINIRAMNENYLKFRLSDIKKLDEENVSTTIEAKRYSVQLPNFADILDEAEQDNLLLTSELTTEIETPKQMKSVGHSLHLQMTLNKDKEIIQSIGEFPNGQTSNFTIKFEEHELAGIDIAKLAVFEFVGDPGKWIKLGGSYNSEEKSFTFATTHPGKYAVFEDQSIQSEEIPVKVRVEGFNETILPLTEINVAPYDITNVVGDNKIGNWYLNEANPLAIHAIIKALEINNFDVEDLAKFDFGEGEYISKINGLETNSVNPSKDGWMYAVNDQYVDNGVGSYTIKSGDEITVYFTPNYQEISYSWFDKNEISTTVGSSVNVVLKTEDGFVPDATLLIGNKPLLVNGETVKTNAQGEATIAFTEPGEYYVSAEKLDKHYSVISRPFSKIVVGSENTSTAPLTVTIQIDGVKENIISSSEVTIESGDTVLKALKQLLDEKKIPYVNHAILDDFISVNGESAGSFGGKDGWDITVNDVWSPLNYELQSKDKIHLYYKRSAKLSSPSILKSDKENPTVQISLVGDTFTDEAREINNWAIEGNDLTITNVTLTGNQAADLQLHGKVRTEAIQVTALPQAMIGKKSSSVTIALEPPKDTRSIQEMINDTVSYYKNENQVISSWESLVALWGAGEDLTDGTWKLPDWKMLDPGLKEDAGGTDHIRYIFGLLAMQQDPSNAWQKGRNLYTELAAQQKADGSIGGLNKHVWAMLALDAGVARGHDVGKWNANAKEKALKHVMDSQNKDGGFALFGTESDVDMTGMSLLALSNYQGDSAADAVIDKAKGYLKARQQDLNNGGFKSPSMGDNSNSLSAAVSGLVAVGENLSSDQWMVNGKTVVDAFKNFQKKDGSFLWKGTISNSAASEQALNALTSLENGSVWKRISKAKNPEQPIEPSVTKEQLNLSIATAEQKLATTQEGTTTGTYTKASRDQLQQAITEAKVIEADGQADQQQVNVATSDLQRAITLYNESIIKPEKPTPPAVTDRITFSVETRTIGAGDIISPKQLEIQKGDTAFTALKRELESRSISLNYSGVGPTVYVKAINSLGEFDKGPQSGWMYSVNGEFPQYSAGIYGLKDGDVLRWQYTTNLGADLGENWNPNPEPNPGPNPTPTPDPKPEPTISAPEKVEATIENGKLHIQVKDEKTGELQPAKIEKTEVVGGYVIVQIGELGEELDALEGIELPPGEQKVVVLDNDKPYSYFKPDSGIKTTKEWAITFSAPVLNESENLEKVVVRNAVGEVVDVNIQFGEDGKSLTIKPTGTYEKGELYYITIAEMKSASGIVLKEPIRKIFIVE